jgi:hypothetical protein
MITPIVVELTRLSAHPSEGLFAGRGDPARASGGAARDLTSRWAAARRSDTGASHPHRRTSRLAASTPLLEGSR